MTRWLISIPVFGERYVDEFCAVTLPAVEAAIIALGATKSVEVSLIVHTDQPDRVREAAEIPMHTLPVPDGESGFYQMSNGHRNVLARGRSGDVVVLLTAGAVISKQALVYCAEVLSEPHKRVVLCAVPRVNNTGPFPDTSDAQSLMDWAWTNRHAMVRECTWSIGRAYDLTRAYFVCGKSVICRASLPHPIAVRIDGRPLNFNPTVDANLMLSWSPPEMHLVQNSQRLAVVKLSPPDMFFERVERTMAERQHFDQLVVSNRQQRWCVRQRIMLCGEDPGPDQTDDLFANSIRGGE